MCNWKAWIWPGILTVAILSALALWMQTDAIEADLKTKATAALVENGQSWAQVSMDGRDATIMGDAPSEAAQSEAEFITDEAYSVRVVDNQTGLMAAQSPYIFQASRQSNAIELSGFVPDEKTRATVLASVKEALPGMRVTDNTEYARGAPEGFAALSGFAITQLKGLKDGSASTSDSELSVQGMANTLEDFDGINTALAAALPGNGQVGTVDVQAPAVSPYTWQAEYDGEKAVLSGFVPDRAAADTLAAAAKEALPEAEIVDEQKLASGAPDGFANNAKFALAQLPAFSSGSVALSDKVLNVKGNSSTPQEYAASRLALTADRLPEGMTLGEQDIKVAAVSPYTWQATKAEEGITLAGYVPDEDTRAAIVAAAGQGNPGAAVKDTMQIAAGAAEQFGDQTNFALGQLGGLSSGSVTLSDTNYFVKGKAATVDEYEQITQAANGELPSGLSLGAAEIEAATQTPYNWNAEYDGNRVKLGGFVPDSATREDISAVAKAAFPDADINDEMRIAAGQGDTFSSDAKFGLNQLSTLTKGSVALSDRSLTINGMARTPDSYDAVNEALSETLPTGISVAQQNIEPATVSPYSWGAEYDGTTVALSGFVPDEDAREKLNSRAKATLPAATVKDEMRVAVGNSESFEANAAFALKQFEAFEAGKASLSDKVLTIEGTARSPEDFAAVNSALADGLPEGLSVARQNITPPTVSPYIWGADYDGETVVLNGSVPSEESRAALTKAAQENLPEAQISDRMQLARGAPEQFDRNGAFAISQLSNFSNGSVGISDNTLKVEGVSRDVDAFDASKAALEQLPEGLTVAQQDIRPSTVSPYRWSATRDGSDVTLEGFVPSASVKRTIAEGVKKAMPEATITDNSRVAAGAPNGFDTDVEYATKKLALLESGTIALEDRQIDVTGRAASVGDYASVNAQLGAPPAGATLRKREIAAAAVSPYSWGADYDGDTVRLNGFVPSETVRKDINDEAAKRLRGKSVEDNMQIAAGAPEGFSAAATSAISLLPRLKSGNVALSNNNLTVEGEAKDGGNYTAALSAVKNRLPEGVTVAQANIVPPKQAGDYTFDAKMSESSVVLSGQVPSVERRRALGDRAKEAYPGRTVVNRLTVASGAPENFDGNVDKGLELLSQMKTGSAKVVNDTLTVDGQAASVASYGALVAAKGDVPGTIQPAVVTPYSWAIDDTGDKTVLSGFAPNEGASNAIAAATRATLGKDITNQQRIASGAPDGFGNAQAALITSVNQLENGRATLTGTSAFVQGRADSEEEAGRIGDSIAGSLPENYTLRRQISYLLPLPETKVKLKKEFKPAPVPDPVPEIKLKEEFVPAPVKEPEIAKEEEPAVAAADATKPAAAEEPAVAVKPEEPASAVCTVDFAALFKGESILFDTAKADIKPASFALLDRIAAGLSQCTASKIEVGGHTDSRGSARYNQALSEARAQSVLAYLAKKDGVNAENLTAKGYGETTPIVSNTGAERSKNRRIEFKIIGN